MIKKLGKGFGLGFLVLAFVFSFGYKAHATSTYAVNSVLETGILHISGTGTGTTAALAGVGLTV